MDWFEILTGFRETDYDDTRAKLAVDGSRLQSLINGKSYAIGNLELLSLQALRDKVVLPLLCAVRVRIQNSPPPGCRERT
jgi:hypothetical protein